MAQVCTICSHNDKDKINRALLTGQSNRSIAAQYGLAETSLRRHKDNHLTQALIKGKEVQEVTQADTLIGDLQFLKGKAMTLLGKAQEVDDLKAASSLIGQARQVIETLAEVRGELDRTQTVNIFINPQFQQVQNIILHELEAYPEIRSRIVSRLTEAGR